MMDRDARTVVVSNSSETMDVLAGVLKFSKSIQARKGVLITFLLLAGVIGGVYYVTADRVYQSEGELLIMKSGANVKDANNGGAQVVTDDMPTFEKMMKSDSVIQQAIRALPSEHLRDFYGVSASNWERVYRSRLSVTTARDTNIMTITFRSGSPETAQVVVDTLLTQYITYINAVFERDADDRLKILEAQRATSQREINAKIAQHMKLLSHSNILIEDDERITNIYTASVKTLNDDVLNATKRRVASQELYFRLKEAINNREDLLQFALQMTESTGTGLLERHIGVDSGANAAAARLWEDIVDAQAQLKDKLSHLGPNHPKVRELETEIETKRQRLQELPEYTRQAANGVTQTGLGPHLLAIAKHRYELAVVNERDLKREFEVANRKASKMNSQLAEIRSVKTTIDQLRNYHDGLSNSIANIGLDKEHQLFTQITSQPQIEPAPISPKLTLVVVVSLFLGFAGACASIYVLDLMDDRFHSPDDLRSQLGVPILAMVRRLERLGDHGIKTLHTFSRPNSPESEAFRTLRAALDFTGGGARRITISSTEPGDGKTTILSNLAVAFAQSGKRTLLIDGDMRRPGLTRLFERNSQAGLSTILRDSRPIVDSVIGAIQQTEMDNLHVLPAGPRPVNPVELLTNDRLSELFEWAETSYDRVLIDAPPSLAVTDAAIIGRLVDGAILTVRPDKNRRKLVLRASEALTSLGCELLGVVINSVQSTGSDEYGYAYGHGVYGHDDPVASEDHAEDAAATAATGSTIGMSRDRSTRRARRRRAA